jgi:hypothetical protein
MAEAKKRVAVIIRDRHDEGLRMAVGLTVLGDSVDVYVMDTLIEKAARIDMILEALHQMGGSIYTNEPGNPFQLAVTDEVAARLTSYDAVLPY